MAALPEGGIKFGQYVLLRRIARGGMAEVFLAQQRGLEGFDRRVAVKRILPHLADSPDFVKMFLGEAKLAAQLTHPNVVHIYDFGKVGSDYFIAMEFVDGVHAGQLFKLGERGSAKPDPMPPTLVARLGADAATALHYAHELRGPGSKPLNLVHRDVSPANLMVSFDGVVKLCDFGIAKAAALSDQLTNPGQVKGKYAYMSPEQTIAAPLDGRSDVFSLAIVLWELITGKTIVGRGDAVDAMRAIRDGKLERLDKAAPGTPKPLVDALQWALETKRDKRATAADLAQALEAFIKSSPEIGTPMQLAMWVRPRFTREPTGEHATYGTAAAGTVTPDPDGPDGASPGTAGAEPGTVGAEPGTQLGAHTSTQAALKPRLIAASRSPSQVDDDAETINMGPPSAIAEAIAKRANNDATIIDKRTADERRSPNVIVDRSKLRPLPEPRRAAPRQTDGATIPVVKPDLMTLEADLVDEHSEDEFRDTLERNAPAVKQPVIMTASVPSLVRDPHGIPGSAAQIRSPIAIPTERLPYDRRTPTIATRRRTNPARVALAIALLALLMIASFLIALSMRGHHDEPPKRSDAAVSAAPIDAAAIATVTADAAESTEPPDAASEALLEVQTSPPDAAITVDGQTRTAPAKYALPAGTYTIRAELAGYDTESRQVELAAGQHIVPGHRVRPQARRSDEGVAVGHDDAVRRRLREQQADRPDAADRSRAVARHVHADVPQPDQGRGRPPRDDRRRQGDQAHVRSVNRCALRASTCVASITRTVPDRLRITIDCVFAVSPMKRTPSSR